MLNTVNATTSIPLSHGIGVETDRLLSEVAMGRQSAPERARGAPSLCGTRAGQA